MLRHAPVEGLFGFPYIKVRALLCVLNDIHNISEFMCGCLVIGVDQALVNSGLKLTQILKLQFFTVTKGGPFFHSMVKKNKHG